MPTTLASLATPNSGDITRTIPTGRVYRTSPDGYDLFPQLRPACRAPTPRRRSHSQDKAKRIAHARSRLRDQRPVNAETRRVNRARKQEIADRTWRNHMRKMLILFKGAQPSTSPWCAWVNDPLEPDNSHPTGNHHPHHHTNSTTSHPSENYEDPCGNYAYAGYKS